MKYLHYKGGTYTVLGIAEHTETGEQLVAYHDAKGSYWVRPKKMFFGDVEADGKRIRRFKPLRENE